MKLIQTILVAGGLVMLATGCHTMTAPELKTQGADTYEQHLEKDGLVIGIHPMIDRAEVKKTFNVDLLGGNILPILVVAENRNSSASFIIVREKIFVFDATTGTTDATARKNVTTGKYATGQVLMALGGVATVMMGAKMSSDATVIEYGIADKMFYSRTIEPGQKAQGFLYFQLPKDFSYSTNYHVIAESKNTTTATVIPFDFDMNLHLNKL